MAAVRDRLLHQAAPFASSLYIKYTSGAQGLPSLHPATSGRRLSGGEILSGHLEPPTGPSSGRTAVDTRPSLSGPLPIKWDEG